MNSALQRARKIIAGRLPGRSQQQTLRRLGDVRLRDLVERYTLAFERGYTGVLIAMLAEDASWSMPPQPSWYWAARRSPSS